MDGPSLSKVLSASDDNLAEYFLFPGPSLCAKYLSSENELLITLSAAAANLMKGYIWHKEPFELKRIDLVSASASTCPIFGGKTGYGDNVEDEWFVVHILIELTKQFDDLVIRVIDHDGEFLLIEAAEHLPSWAESDSICSQRVYLYKGKAHLVTNSLPDLANPDPENQEPIDLLEAIKFVRDPNTPTEAAPEIQNSITNRIGSYPDKMTQNFHHVTVFLPPKVGILLKQRPDLISAAIQAFYFKDPIDTKSTRSMQHFQPNPNELVKYQVRCTKALYAMLSSQDYRPDVRANWKFPCTLDSNFKAHCLGAKLTIGFEILLSRCKSQTSDEVKNLDSLPLWHRYDEKLKSYNYYQDFLEGSKPYSELKTRAQAYFNTTMNTESNSEDLVDKMHSLCKNVFSMYSSITTEDIVGFQEECKETTALPDDDEAWMEINPDDLESLLEAQFKTRISDQKLDQIPDKLKEFLAQMSDFTGVETAEAVSGTNKTVDEIGLEPLDFRADDFVSAMDKILAELGKPDGEWEGSDQEGFTDDDDDEDDKRFDAIFKKHNFAPDSKIHELMGRMDEELADSEVGKTFTNEGIPSQSKPKSSSGRAKVEELDEFDKTNSTQGSSTRKYAPVDIDMNALTSMLESFQSQNEPSGPSETLLRSVGFDISKAKK